MARKTFAQMAAERPKYDPSVDGYGNPDQWREAFRARMGLEEAQKVCGTRSARGILGLSPLCTWEEVKAAYKKGMLQYHPDRIASTNISLEEATRKTRELNAAFALLAKEFGK